MMKPLTLTGLVIVLGANALAQPTYERIYDGVVSFRFNLTELPGGNVLVGLGRTRAVSRLDPSGNILQTHSYWANPTFPITGLGGIRKLSSNVYLFAAGYRKDTCSATGTSLPNFHPLIGKMDTLGNLLALKHYVLNEGCRNIGVDIVPTNDGGMVSWGHERSFFALKADSDLAPIWAKRFDRNGGFQFVRELPGGDLLAGINMDTAGAVVARLDSDGNFLWCKSYIRPRGVVHDAVIESNDSFVITGFTDSTGVSALTPLPGGFQPKLFLMKLNGNGDVQWCRGYDSAPNYWHTPKASRIVRTQGGNYAVLATLGYLDYNMFFRPFLMETDLSGDTVWTSSVGYLGLDHYAVDLLPYSDGGYLFNGVVWGDLPGGNLSSPYLFKTDSLGHFPCWERTHTVQVMDLFPADSSFTLNSIDGVTALPAFVSDTTFAPIAVYDGCTFTTGIPPIMNRSHTKPRIRPNPNTGQFTVEFADPLVAQSYYSVYDAMGKLLYQRPLPAGATVEEIDLSRFGRGTYAIKFTSPAGVSYEKVVVE